MHKRKTILIVEDDRFLAKAYENAFAELNCDFKILFDGEKVIETMLDLKPDLVLLDILLPLKDGFEILEERQKIPALLNIPVVIASNLGQEEEVSKAKILGAVAYIVKSDTSMADVVKTVKNYL